MVREKLEATVLSSAVLTSHRKSFQRTTCTSTGKVLHKVRLTADLVVDNLHGVLLTPK